MIAYTIHEPPNAPSDPLDRAEGLVMVKDGFSWWAAFATPFWLLAHRMWLVLVLYVSLAVLLHFGLKSLGLTEAVSSIITVGIGILLGFEADTLRRWTLDRRGFRTLGSVTGKNAAECERRFFDAWLPGELQANARAAREVIGGYTRHEPPATTARAAFLGGVFARGPKSP